MDAKSIKQSRSSDKDRISRMPVEILFIILAKLPRKSAIRTGVLSTDWKDTWKYRFPHKSTLRFIKATNSAAEQKIYAQEIQKIMSDHGDKKIEIFELYFYAGKVFEKEASQWVEQAVKNRVDDLFLDFSQASLGSYPVSRISARAARFELKEKLFKHANNCVTYFSLHYCRLNRLFKFKPFNCLEIIRLQNVNINDGMFGRLMFNCRKLQIIDLKLCGSLKQVIVPDQQINLKKIAIVYCHGITRVDISAPELRSFHFIGTHPNKFRLNDNMQSLSDVVLISSAESMLVNYETLNVSSVQYFWFVNVQVLTLCSISLKVMIDSDMFMKSKITLDNLKELHLIMHSLCDVDIQNIYSLFNNCKESLLLEKLFIELPKYPTIDHSMSDKRWQTCNKKFEHLKTIKISNFKREPNEYMLLYFLLYGALNLEVAVVVFDPKLARYLLEKTVDRFRLELILHTIKMGGSSSKAKIFTCPPSIENHRLNATHSEVIRKLEPIRTIHRDLC